MADKKAKAEDEPKAEQPKQQDTGTAGIEGKTIDERMADLLEEHKKMGAR
jgi:hypothetical protein